LYGWALAKRGRLAEAFDVFLAAVQRPFDGRRFGGATEMLRNDASLVATALARRKSAAEIAALKQRGAILGVVPNAAASTSLTLTWETDESDLDLLLFDKSELVTQGAIDVRTGYGPESFVLLRPEGNAAPRSLRVDVHAVSLGPAGHAFGKVGIVHQSAGGELRFDDRPFVVTTGGAAISLGSVIAP
jgi:hypothetical protein